jgi:flagellar biosynthesis protein FliR
MSDANKQPATTEEQMSLADQSQQVFDSVGAVLADYQQQWSARFSLAGKEWQLTKQSVTIIVVLCLMLAATLSTLWLISNVALGFMLYQAGLNVYILCLCLMALNIGLMLIIWKTIKTLCKNVGFSRSINSLTGDTKGEELQE